MSERQSYNPYHLIDDVEALLRSRGVRPGRSSGSAGDRLAGAGQLLRGLGVEPLMATGDAVDLDGHAAYNRRVHGD